MQQTDLTRIPADLRAEIACVLEPFVFYVSKHGNLKASDFQRATELHAALTSPEPAQEPTDTESVCRMCGGFNPVWFAPNELWRRVFPQEGIVCPTCFIKAAERLGVTGTAWRIEQEDQ